MCEFKNSVVERLSDLLKTGEYSDTEFLLNNGEVVKGHRLLFAVSSPVFAAMMYGEMAEKSTIEVVDIEPHGFKSMMTYMYTDNLKLNSVSHAMSVYEAGHKYDVPNLEKLAKEFITCNVDVDSALESLEFSKLHEDSEIRMASLKVVVDKTDSVLNSKYFLNCSIDTLETIANEDKLHITQSEFFSFIDKWAVLQAKDRGEPVSNFRHLLINVIRKIGFLSMHINDFLSVPYCSELLTAEEKSSLLLNISDSRSVPMPNGFCELPKDTENFWWTDSTQITVKWKVMEISKTQYSPKFYVDNCPFRIYFQPNIQYGIKQIGLFLSCDCKTAVHGVDWSCNVDFALRILRNEDGNPFQTYLERQLVHNFTREESDWGYKSFIQRTELDFGGYIDNEGVMIEAVVKVGTKIKKYNF